MIIKCPACEQKNRFAASKIADKPKCGACKTVIDYYAYPVDVGMGEFDDIIKTAKVPVVVDFWSPTCPPCLMVGPELEKFAEANPHVLVLKVNATQNLKLLQRYGITGVPTFKVFKNGESTKTVSGYRPASKMPEDFGVAL